MEVIDTKHAPQAIGTYSQAIKNGKTIYLSGQIPLDPETMQLCTGTIEEHIKQVLNNLKAVCHAAGGNLSDLVKLNVYLVDLKNFSLINEAMNEYFSAPYPARAVIGVAALPKGAEVEMDGIMVLEN